MHGDGDGNGVGSGSGSGSGRRRYSGAMTLPSKSSIAVAERLLLLVVWLLLVIPSTTLVLDADAVGVGGMQPRVHQSNYDLPSFSIESIRPPFVIRGTDTLVSLMGGNFTASAEDDDGWSCWFGPNRVDAQRVSEERLDCRWSSPAFQYRGGRGGGRGGGGGGDSSGGQYEVLPIAISLPALASENDSDASINLNAIPAISEGFKLTVLDRIVTLSAHPSLGPVSGGTIVIVKVRQQLPFHTNISYSCRFANATARAITSATVVNRTHLQCVSPGQMESGRSKLSIHYRFALGDGTGTDDCGVSDDCDVIATWFTHYQQPAVEKIYPPALIEMKAATVTLRGSGFHSAYSLICRFVSTIGGAGGGSAGGSGSSSKQTHAEASGSRIRRNHTVNARGRMISPQKIQCDAPPSRPGPVAIEVSANDGIDFSSDGNVLSVYPRFTILSKSFEEGSTRGGANMVVLGTNFREEMGMACYFGTHRRAGAVYLSSNELSCRIPPSSVLGPVAFEVCWGQRLDCVGGGTYLYREELHLLDAYPRSSPNSGGVLVKVTMNRRIPSGLSCMFGFDSVPIEGVEGCVGYCRSPALLISQGEGRVHLTVSGGGYDVAMGAFLFRYLPPVVLRDVMPRSIPEVEAGLVRLTGKDFPNVEGLACVLDDADISSNATFRAIWVSRELVWCNITIPGVKPGSYALAIVYGDQMFPSRSANAIELNIHPAISITNIFPSSGPPGTTVAVYGTNLVSSESVACRFGTDTVPVHSIVNSSCVTCVVPFDRGIVEADGAASLAFRVSANGVHFPADPHASFTFANEAKIWSLDPDIVDFSRTNVTISINGTGLDSLVDSYPYCRLGGKVLAKVKIRSSSQAECQIEILPGVGIFALELMSSPEGHFRTANHLRVVPTPQVSAAQPSWTLPSVSGTKVFLRGSNFTNWKLSCIFDRDIIVPAMWFSSSLAMCEAPSLRKGQYTLRVSNDGLLPLPKIDIGGFGSNSESVNFVVFEPVQLHSIVPSSGSAGTIVTISGRDFLPEMACKFQDAHSSAPIRFINSTHAECKAPPFPGHYGPRVVDIVLEDFTVSTGDQLYFDYIDLSIASITPSSGSVLGGTVVTVELQQKDVDSNIVTYCKFGDIVVEVLAVHFSTEAEKVQCIAPAMPAEGILVASFSLSTSEKSDFVPSHLFFVYLLDPVVHTVEPLNGPETGGTEMVFYGGNFATRVALGCRFIRVSTSIVDSVSDSGTTSSIDGMGGSNDTNAVSIVDGEWFSMNSVSCVTPPLSPGKYSVEMTLNGLEYFDLEIQYTSEPTVTISEVSPMFARSSGGTILTIQGTNFDISRGTIVCRFDNFDIQVAAFNSPSEIECRTPQRHIAGPSHLAVSNNGVDFVAFDAPIAFYEDFVLETFAPNFGTIRGGTKINVRGGDFANLQDSVFCEFGRVASVLATIDSDTVLSCPTPAVSIPSNETLSIVYGADMYSLPELEFSYEPDVEIDFIYPSSLPSNVERTILVTGGPFRRSSLLCCRLTSTTNLADNDIQYTEAAKYIDQHHVYCSVPVGLKPGGYTMTVSNNCQDFAVASLWNTSLLQVENAIQTLALSPDVGLCEGSSSTVITGTNFVEQGRLSCRFEEHSVVPAYYMNSTHIKCSVPAKGKVGLTLLEIMVDYVPVVTDFPLYFECIDLSVSALIPSAGSTKGGSKVFIKLRRGLAERVSHCRFGDSVVMAKTVAHTASEGKADNTVECISPPFNDADSAPLAKVPLDLSVNGMEFTSSHLWFTYFENPAVESIEPSTGPESGGTQINLKGKNFLKSAHLTCRLVRTDNPGIEIKGTWISKERVCCVVPRTRTGIFPGDYSLELSTNGVDFVYSGHTFTAHPEIAIHSIEPSAGPADGGTDVVVRGGPFISSFELQCSFGFAGDSTIHSVLLVPAVYLDVSSISCISPNYTKLREAVVANVTPNEAISIQVTANGIDQSNALPFHYYIPPILRSMTPRQGSANETRAVIIHGEHFVPSLSSTTFCRFGSVVVNAFVLSTLKIRCDAPALQVGDFEVRVSFNNGTDWSHPCYDTFEYRQIGTILSVSPPGGPSSGGTMVLVKGSNFFQSSMLCCKFDSIEANLAVWISPSEVHCRSPSRPPGISIIRVLNDCNHDDETSNTTGIFEFYHRPVVSSLVPLSGPEDGGTPLTIHGRYLRHTEGLFCSFSSDAGDGIVRVDASASPDGSNVECTSPSKASFVDNFLIDTRLNVAVGDGSGVYHTEGEMNFQYANVPTLSDLSPPFGSSDGRYDINVQGGYFNTTGEIWCRFTSTKNGYRTIAHGSSLTSTSVMCNVPAESESKGFHALPTSPNGDSGSILVDLSTNGVDWSSRSLVFQYLAIPSVSYISPLWGMQGGETRMIIIGENFDPARRYDISFGSFGVVEGQWRSNITLSALSPPSRYPGQVDIAIIVDGAFKVSPANSPAFEYLPPINVIDLHPTRGPLDGGTLVTVYGNNFAPVNSLACRFGGASIVSGHFISEKEIVCTTPMGVVGASRLEVSVDGQQYSESSNSTTTSVFIYEHLPSIGRIIPGNIPLGRTGEITLYGNYFVNTSLLACRFGVELVDAVFHSSQRISCQVPASISSTDSSGALAVGITTNGVDFSIDRISLRLLNETSVISVSPNIFQEGVETEILVKGSNFLNSPDLFCFFGRSYNMTMAQWLSPTSLRCRSPPLLLKWSPEGVEVSVTNNGGHSFSTEGPIIHLKTKAYVHSMSPSFGFTRGGADVIIRSNHFNYVNETASMCLWGEARSSARQGASQYEVVCTSPRHPVASDVRLYIAFTGTSPIYVGNFSFLEEPVIISAKPSHGSIDGGTEIAISGENLDIITSCIFSVAPGSRSQAKAISAERRRIVVPARLHTSSLATCVSPGMTRQANALVFLTTSAGGGYTSNEQVYFQYRNTPRLLSVSPSIGSDVGGTMIFVEGDGFQDTPDLNCRFGAGDRSESVHVVPARFLSHSRIHCTTPKLPTGEVSIQVTTNGFDYTPDSLPYIAHGPVAMFAISPSLGTVMGGTRVLVKATNILLTEKLGCRFGDFSVHATYVGPSTLSCVSPEVLATGSVEMAITLNGHDHISGLNGTATTFTYVSAPKVESITPNQGWTSGGTKVVLQVRNVYEDPVSHLYCAFGKDNLVAAHRHNDTMVTCISPGNGGNVVVPVSLIYEYTRPKTYGGPTFSYVQGAIVNSIAPSVGDTLGGTSCTLNGANFQNLYDLQCVFSDGSKGGWIQVPARFIDENHVTCPSPAQRVATGTIASIKVESASGFLKTAETYAQFTYVSPISVYGLYPPLGSSSGGTRVTVSGHGFSQSFSRFLSCRFGHSPPILAEFLSDHEVVCATPSLSYAGIGNTTVEVALSANGGHDWVSARDEDVVYTYTSPLRVMSVRPTRGSVQGGTRVTVTFAPGTNLTLFQELVCHFGSHHQANASLVDNESLECTAPPMTQQMPHDSASSTTSSVHLEISVHGGNDMTSSQITYSYYDDPSVERVTPSYGYFAGGEMIRVLGYGFVKSSEVMCKFGNHLSPRVQWMSSGEIRCEVPRMNPNDDEKSVTVEVAMNGMDFKKGNQNVPWPEYTYEESPSAVDVRPAFASADGGTLSVIKGKNLQRATSCRFGTLGEVVPVINKTISEIFCKPPAILPNSPYLSGDEADIFVEYEEIGFESLGLSIVYEPHRSKDELYRVSLNDTNVYPEVAKIEPGLIGANGGYRIHVFGNNFVNRQGLACSFEGPIISTDTNTSGGGSATTSKIIPARYVSSNEIFCLSPRLSLVDPTSTWILHVINGGPQLKPSNGMELTIFADISITTVVPSFGPVRGGTDVTVIGTYPTSCLLGSAMCQFGTVSVYAHRTEATSKTIFCVAPEAFHLEEVQVRVSCNGGKSFSESYGLFSYEENVEVTVLEPKHGGVGGGTEVLITGRDFKNSTTLNCRFGSSTPISATYLSNFQILCSSPPRHGPGQVAVEVTTNGADYTSSLQLFEYRMPPSIKSIWPNSGDAAMGGTEVYITGSYFYDEYRLGCSFDDIIVHATFIDSNMISCISPPHLPGVFSLTVIGNLIDGDLSYNSETLEFLFFHPPSIVRITPRRGSASGGIPVFLTGSNFLNTTALRCRFGSAEVRATFVSNNTSTCVAPPLEDNAGPHRVPLTVSVNGKDFSPIESDVSFEYLRDSLPGHYRGPSSLEWNTPAPNGTFARSGDVNFTLCEPGSFQPKSGQDTCLPAPIGYYASDFGMAKPTLCNSGFVCDRTGLRSPASPCPRGHYCREGTKSMRMLDISLLYVISNLR